MGGLLAIGHGCLQCDVRVELPQLQHRLSEIQIAAVGHTADKMTDTGGIHRVHGVI